MKVLLVWEEVPDSTKFFVFDNPSLEDILTLTVAHGGMINCDIPKKQEEALSLVYAAIQNMEDVPSKKQWKKDFKFKADVEYWLGRWKSFEITTEAVPNAGPFTQVFWAGFAL
jgi:hypothetical protein